MANMPRIVACYYTVPALKSDTPLSNVGNELILSYEEIQQLADHPKKSTPERRRNPRRNRQRPYYLQRDVDSLFTV